MMLPFASSSVCTLPIPLALCEAKAQVRKPLSLASGRKVENKGRRERATHPMCLSISLEDVLVGARMGSQVPSHHRQGRHPGSQGVDTKAVPEMKSWTWERCLNYPTRDMGLRNFYLEQGQGWPLTFLPCSREILWGT